MTTERRPDDTEVSVVGIGADGWAGLAPAARAVLGRARVVLGARASWACSLRWAPTSSRGPRRCCRRCPALLEEHAGGGLVVLASGDPMFSGIGRAVPAARRRQGDRAAAPVARRWPAPGWAGRSRRCRWSAWSGARCPGAARRPRRAPAAGARLRRHHPGRGRRRADRVGVRRQPADGARQLGGPAERQVAGTADGGPPARRRPQRDRRRVRGRRHRQPLPLTPGSAGRRRTSTTASSPSARCGRSPWPGLAPAPGELLWDVGGGAGSIGIEWMRAHPQLPRRRGRGRPDPGGADRRATPRRLGVPGLQVVTGRAPEALAGLPTPDAVFVGGRADRAGPARGLLGGAASRRPAGGQRGDGGDRGRAGRSWHAAVGGELVRIAVSRARAGGRFTGWKPGMPVTHWNVSKSGSPRSTHDRALHRGRARAPPT